MEHLVIVKFWECKSKDELMGDGDSSYEEKEMETKPEKERELKSGVILIV